MHILLTSVGTDGDIFPYVGLGIALRARGHSVSLVASAHYERLATTHGFAFHPLVSTTEHNELFAHPDFWKPLKTGPLSARWGLQYLRRQYDLLSGLVTRDTILVANPGVLAAGLVHEKSGVPWTNLILQPWMIPSSIAPPRLPGLSCLVRAPRPIWKLIWRGLDAVVDFLVARDLNVVRVSLGLRPTRRVVSNWLARRLVIGMFPAWYGLPQADWPSQLQLTGFPLFDGGEGDGLSAEVLEFCRAGAPPVAFTFGTGMAHSSALFRSALEACARLGLRGIVLTKYRDQLPDSLPPSVLHCAFAPFQKLFPHCAAVVHHGGIGTVAKALAAGVPQLIVPLCFDQSDNGVRIERLGVGDWLRSSRMSGNGISVTLAPLLTAEMRARCGKITTQFGVRDALASAAECVETVAT